MLFMCAQSEYSYALRSINALRSTNFILFNILIIFRSFMTTAHKKQKMFYFYNQVMAIAK